MTTTTKSNEIQDSSKLPTQMPGSQKVDHNFQLLVESLHSKHEALLSMTPRRFMELPDKIPDRGVYLFSEEDCHLYVGRTNRMRQRLQAHCRQSGSHFNATFAFRIAREETGITKASYSRKGSRSELVLDSVFKLAFERAKERVAAMAIRFVEERNPVQQALLKSYVATVLATRYNDFDNH